jgi:hypothetical protein
VNARRWLVPVLLAATFVSEAGAGAAFDVDPVRYRAAVATATVAVRAYAEPRPNVPETPLTDTTLVLLPRSEALLARVAEIKAGARDSLAKYRGAVTAVRLAHEELAQALVDAAAEELVRRGAVDAAGAGSFDGVPAGDWILIAWRSEFVNAPSGKTSRRDRRMYSLGAPLEGYRAVSVWMRELRLTPERREAIELTDRNVWFSGIEEVARTGADR